ncbi:hypothetical protein [uncultured Lamprocystis sp.]|jgi:hypothetical protein|uniref:hypothetical protein n=1 Tax=uncultured Lamprocystis sp. TaxID=543132 RepID=UPI0025CDD557|nr:hypothetical protein [uncultured Lamprocystis sp.]
MRGNHRPIPAEHRRETVDGNPAFMPRHSITVPAVVWSVLAPLSPVERDRMLAAALAPRRSVHDRVLVRDPGDRPLAPCTAARARQLVKRAGAEWVSYLPPVIRLTGTANGASR